MSDLVIGSHVIDSDVGDILSLLRKATGKPKDFRRRGDNYQVACPFHKNGEERHPSCQVYCGDDPEVEYGYMHCFTCGESGSLWHFVGECLGRGDEAGRKWLLDNFGDAFLEKAYDLPPLIAPDAEPPFDESSLAGLQPWHPYMAERKLSRKVCEEFGVGYDEKGDCLVFPVRDERGTLVMTTRRSVKGKRFMVDAEREKPVYLLYKAVSEGYSEVVVCESQINALYCYSMGYPAIALFGTGTKRQYGAINRSGIRTFHLAFDGDEAGRKGAMRFLENLSPSRFADVLIVPRGKDVNDLSREEFESLPIVEGHAWMEMKGKIK